MDERNELSWLFDEPEYLPKTKLSVPWLIVFMLCALPLVGGGMWAMINAMPKF
jgi:hypothetical protein